MIRPINFLWKQLNGPQITAVVKACYNWCVSQFDALLDYFSNLTIKTAVTNHLNIFGMIANFSRPSIRVVDKAFFLFEEDSFNPDTHGFANLEKLSEGGIFADMQKVYESEHGVPLSDNFFRVVLQTYVNSKGEIGGLALIDDLCYALKQYVGNDNSSYELNIQTEVVTNRDYGDIFIDLGLRDNWNNWDSVVAALQALVNTSYAPLPRVFVGYTSD